MKNPFSKKITDESWEKTEKRYEAFFNGEVADRPPVYMTFWNPKADKGPADWGIEAELKTEEEYKKSWLDTKKRAAALNYTIDNTEYYADALPTVFPNLGPEILSAMCGCPYRFSKTTTWTEPCIFDWEKDADRAVFDRSNEYFIAADEFARELMKYSKDKFAVGFTDMHGGGDHLAALRDPENLCADLYDEPEWVKSKLKSSYEEYQRIYDYFYSLTTISGEPVSAWTPLVSFERFNVVQNDFSCMISKDMYEEFFLNGLIEECEKLDKSIYHLDGPDALRHLDNILEVKKLSAVQWICGAGNEGFERWIPVYKKIQNAHKGMQLIIDAKELDSVFANLKPDGIWFSSISGIKSKEEADIVLKRINNWK